MLDKLCIRATRDIWGIGGIVGSVRELRIPCWSTHSVVYANPLDPAAHPSASLEHLQWSLGIRLAFSFRAQGGLQQVLLVGVRHQVTFLFPYAWRLSMISVIV